MAITVTRKESWADALPIVGQMIARGIERRQARPGAEYESALREAGASGEVLDEKTFAQRYPSAYKQFGYASYSKSANGIKAGVTSQRDYQAAQTAATKAAGEESLAGAELKRMTAEQVRESTAFIAKEFGLKEAEVRSRITTAAGELEARGEELKLKRWQTEQSIMLALEQGARDERFKQADLDTRLKLAKFEASVQLGIANANAQAQLFSAIISSKGNDADLMKQAGELASGQQALAKAYGDDPAKWPEWARTTMQAANEKLSMALGVVKQQQGEQGVSSAMSKLGKAFKSNMLFWGTLLTASPPGSVSFLQPLVADAARRQADKLGTAPTPPPTPTVSPTAAPNFTQYQDAVSAKFQAAGQGDLTPPNVRGGAPPSAVNSMLTANPLDNAVNLLYQLSQAAKQE